MKQRVVLLGSGRVATHLTKRLSQLEGYEIAQIYSRSLQRAEELRQKLGASAQAIDQPSQIERNASLYIFALSDGAIPTIASQMPQTEGVWLHTAGSVGLEPLTSLHRDSGVLYPLQTFSLEREIDWERVDLYVEASDESVSVTLTQLAQDLGGSIYYADSLQRRRLHLSAVFACNFSNHLWALMEEYLSGEGLPPRALLPLIEETASKLREMPTREAQTGPALRGDTSTLEAHLSLLEARPDLQAIYRLMSESIQKMHPPQSLTPTQ